MHVKFEEYRFPEFAPEMRAGDRKKATRKLLFHKQNGLCYWCRRRMQLPQPGQTHLRSYTATIDHVRPVFCGGKSEPENLVASCNGCNLRKGKKLINPKTGRELSESLVTI